MNQATIFDIRLGWLQRFSAAARYKSLAAAGQECGVDPTALSDSIQRLEEALHRLLIAPATGRLTATGRSFVSRTDKILELSKLSHRTSTNVAIGWFQCLIAISECETYTNAGRPVGWTRYKVMRGVSELENWLDDRLVYSVEIVRLTARGEEILPVAREIVKILEDFCDSNNDLRRDKNKRRIKPWWLRFYGQVEDKIRRRKQ